MRKIEKGSLVVLEQWARSNKGKKYEDLVDRDDIKDAIRHACVREQHGLCAYCCRRITLEKPVLTTSTLKLSAWHPTAHSTFRISLPAAISRVDVAKGMVTSYCV